MLNDFSAARLDAKKASVVDGPGRAAPSNVEAAPAAAPPELSVEDMLDDEDFAKQLQAGMADLLGELEKSVSYGPRNTYHEYVYAYADASQQPEMQAQFEDIFKQLGAATVEAEVEPSVTTTTSTTTITTTTATTAKSGPSTSTGKPTEEESFQETIRKTMERMHASGASATAAATESSAAASGADDLLAEMMKQMQSGGLDGSGANDEDLSKMLAGMMEQLTEKEILYEPMKELDQKFPAWMEKNRAVTPKDELKRYEEQQGLVRRIVERFESPGYSDANAKDREYIVDLMQKVSSLCCVSRAARIVMNDADDSFQMQAAGAPPADLVGDMASAQEAFNAPDEACNPQ
jgi:peroxin-19